MKPKRTKHIAGIIIGALLLFSPLIGLVGTAVGMKGAFASLRSPGFESAQSLSTNVDTVLYATVGGLIGFVAGIITIILSIVFFVRAGRATNSPLSMEG